MEIVDIVLKFLTILLTWPVAFSIVALVFIYKFKQSIQIFLENIISIKVGPFEASQRQVKIPEEKIDDQVTENLQEQGIVLSSEQIQQIDKAFSDLSKEKESKDVEIGNQNEVIRYWVERSELNEFSYLALYLVYNSKLALLWFNSQQENSSTRENFLAQFILPSQIINPQAEKEAIFNALLVNGLIEQNGVLFKISEKGVRFLKHIKFI